MNNRLYSCFTKKVFIGFLLLLSLLLIDSSFSTISAQVSALTNKLEIVEVIYEKDGVFYTQTTAGTVPAGITSSNNDAVNIYRITYTPDNGITEIDVYPKSDDVGFISFATEITNNEAASNAIAVVEPNPEGVTNYDAPSGSFVDDGEYEQAMQRITAFPGVRSYWTVNGTALGPSGSGFQDFMSFLFYIRGTFGTRDQAQTFTEPDAVFLATERDGNSPMLFTPLDINGNPITGSN